MRVLNRTLAQSGICPCCPRHVLIQLGGRRWFRGLAVAALAVDLYAACKFGWL